MNENFNNPFSLSATCPMVEEKVFPPHDSIIRMLRLYVSPLYKLVFGRHPSCMREIKQQNRFSPQKDECEYLLTESDIIK